MNILSSVEQKIKERIQEAAFAAKREGKISFETLPSFVLEKPRDKSHGDYAVNLAMALTKQAKMNPRAIAEALIEYFERKDTYVADMTIAGPGFINMSLDPAWHDQVIPEVLAAGAKYGRSSYGNNKRVQVEFVSANPTGIPHMGNARGAALGDTIATLLDAAGYAVEREYYVNDAGNQIIKFGESLQARYLQALGQDVDFPEDGYHGEDITETVAGYVELHGNELLSLDEEERKEILVKYALSEKLRVIREDLERFGVKYDNWFFESTLYESGAVQKTLDRLRERGLIYEKDGASWLAATKYGEEKDEVMVRQNGTPTYFAADIAYHLNKYERGFETLINVWGADHHGHVGRMKNVINALGKDPDSLEVVLMQLVRLFSGGEIVRMSKRTGRFISLGELMNEVGVDASRYFFVMRSADSHLDFDMDLAKSENSENPVFYVQYAHARIASILRQQEGENKVADLSLLTHEAEIQLIEKIAELPSMIIHAAETREPHRLCGYAHELASLFHSFYGKCRVLNIEPELSCARLELMRATKITLSNVLGMIGVSAPERM
ncbi:arginine--tRNA ligase [Clostridia bacterium]|nr:arginine--tRNA ligase [Clostridia bacterium]